MDALEPGKEDRIVTVKVSDLMAQQVVTAEPHQTVEHVKRVIERNRIHAVPVLDSDPHHAVLGTGAVNDLTRHPEPPRVRFETHEDRRTRPDRKSLLDAVTRILAVPVPFAYEGRAAFGHVDDLSGYQPPSETVGQDQVDVALHAPARVFSTTVVSLRSGGRGSPLMVRRMSLAMALVNDPEIAFLDEPTVGLDPQSRRATWGLIKSLKEKGHTIILTTHYIEEAEALADRVGIIDHGKLIALDTPKTLMEKHAADNLEEVFIKLTGRKIREEV